MRYAQTVLGPVSGDQLGFTLPHEHLLWDLRFYLPKDLDPNDPTDERNTPINPEILCNLKYHLQEYTDNMTQFEVEPLLKELAWFKEAGGGTICDCTSFGLGRQPLKIREASARSGVNVILGTGAYCDFTLPEEINAMDVDTMAQVFIDEIKTGIGDTGIRCGFIGEIGISEPFPEGDRRSLAAAAIAQRETGASILIHQPGLTHAADEIFKIITDNGGDLNRVVMCHCCPLMDDPDYLDHMAKSGAYISYDYFGLEIVLTLRSYSNLWLPTDRDRIRAIRDQIARGNLQKIVLSHDVVYKSMWRQYGGFGYAHLPRDIVPLMLADGYDPAWIKQMTVETPKEIFTFQQEEIK